MADLLDRKSIQFKGGNDPANLGTMSPQQVEFFLLKRALIEAADEKHFAMLADVTSMPRHYGKRIKKTIWYPLLDDRNVNDQGINAEGVHTTHGNLYGSSRDPGNITKELPFMREQGGRINRVGYKRDEITSTLQEFGFFDEYTEDAMIFDYDSQLRYHFNREALRGAHKINEDIIQITLLNSAGVVRYAGAATADDEMTGEGNIKSIVTYRDLVQLRLQLDRNKCPTATKMVTGTTFVDTVTIPKARYMFVGTELEPLLESMADSFGQPAFKPVEKYAAGTKTVNHEIGMIAGFRVISILEMTRWEGAGAAVVDNEDGLHTATNEAGEERYTVFPMLVVGSGSFTHVGFETDRGSKRIKFRIIHKAPSPENASNDEPYGKHGFYSIRWYQSVLVYYPQWIAVQKTLAPFA